jgi:hypothetical protein
MRSLMVTVCVVVLSVLAASFAPQITCDLCTGNGGGWLSGGSTCNSGTTSRVVNDSGLGCAGGSPCVVSGTISVTSACPEDACLVFWSVATSGGSAVYSTNLAPPRSWVLPSSPDGQTIACNQSGPPWDLRLVAVEFYSAFTDPFVGCTGTKNATYGQTFTCHPVLP